ncbi:MAG: nuclear transport factor 2 family protein [Burkholderiales bacterium]|nr:nuclear transport factor 2 family protein [Burkholderiales bacterium]
MPIDTLALWRHMVATRDSRDLDAILSDDVAFYSPIVHKPKLGRPVVRAFLSAMFAGFFNDSFRYVREATGPGTAMLEFQLTLDDLAVNGVHILAWDDEGRLVEFKNLLRPFTALDLVARKMGEALQAQG